VTKILNGSFYGPLDTGAPDSIVVLLHGYGANADDLLPLSYSWAQHLPTTLFWSINGPTPHPQTFMGRQWFGLSTFEPDHLWRDMTQLAPVFKHSIDQELKGWNLTYDNVALVGFSQGGMVALHQNLYHVPVAAAVSFSGILVPHPDETPPRKSPTLLIHGDADRVVPINFFTQAQQTLKSSAVPFEAWVCKGVGHGISPFGLEKARYFLQRFLKKKELATT